jgi:hypothetical protein
MNTITWMVGRALIPWNSPPLLGSREPDNEYYKGLTLRLEYYTFMLWG